MNPHTGGLDPGLAHLGFALGFMGKLEGCVAFSRPADLERAPVGDVALWYADQLQRYAPTIRLCDLTMEHMQTGKGTQGDLLNVQTVGAFLCGRLGGGKFRTVTPAEWKAQLPKKQCFARIRAKLSQTELIALERSLSDVKDSDHEHALDAVGIWLYGQGRMKRGI